MTFGLNVVSPKGGKDESGVRLSPNDEAADAPISPRSALSEEQIANSKEEPETVTVTEKNTFLEVDETRGSKTLSIFRCYTSPVYRRLFSGASSSGINESTVDLASWEDVNEKPSKEQLLNKKSTGNLESIGENEEKTEGQLNRLSLENIEKLNSASSQKKTNKTKEDKRRSRQFTADLEPFGKFEKFDIEPLNSGGRRSSMDAPAPLDDLPLPKHDSSKGNNNLQVRRGSKESEGFVSAMASPSNHADEVKEQPTPLELPARGDTYSEKKILVREEHGGVPEDLCTTIMVRNIPNKYSQRMLLEVFTNYGFDGTFDFLYVPADFFHRLNLGYCFVNFKEPKYAQAFARQFQDYHLPAFKSKKKIQISLANTQGFLPNVMKLEHTALCSQYVSPEFHPICIDPNTNQERPFLSFFPGYEPPPPSRIENPEYWAKKDKEHQKQWEGDSLFPPVLLAATDATTKNNRYVHSAAVTPPNGQGIKNYNNRGSYSNTNRNSGSYSNTHRNSYAKRTNKNTAWM